MANDRSQDHEGKAKLRWFHFLLLLLALTVCTSLRLWLVGHTDIISKDGTYYVSQARMFLADPAEMVRTSRCHPGYPAMMAGVHDFLSDYHVSGGVRRWELAGQIVCLCAALLTTLAIWLFSGMAFGWGVAGVTALVFSAGRKWAVLGADVLSDAPSVCLSLWAVVLALAALRPLRRKSWVSVLAGVPVGLCIAGGYLIRPETLLVLPMTIALWTSETVRYRLSRRLVVAMIATVLVTVLLCGSPYVIASGKLSGKQDIFEQFFRDSEGISADMGQPALSAEASVLAGASIFQAIRRLQEQFFEAMQPVLGFLVYVWVGTWIAWRFFRAKLPIALRLRPGRPCAWMMGLGVVLFGLPVVLYFLRTGILSHRYVMFVAVLLSPLAGAGAVVAGKALRLIWESKLAGRLKPSGVAAMPIVVATLTGFLLHHSLRPLHAGKGAIREAGLFLGTIAGPEDTVLTESRRILHYSQTKGTVFHPEETDRRGFIRLLYEKDWTFAVWRENTLSAISPTLAYLESHPSLNEMRRFTSAARGRTCRVYVYRIDRGLLASREPCWWDLTSGLPGDWHTLSGVKVEPGDDGLTVTTVAHSRQYQVWTPSVLLPAGRYEVRLRIEPDRGALHLGAERVDSSTWIAAAVFEEGADNDAAEQITLPFRVAEPTHTRIVLSNGVIGDRPQIWKLRRVSIVRLGPVE